MRIVIDTMVVSEGAPEDLKQKVLQIVRQGVEDSPLQGKWGIDVMVNSIRVED